MANKYAEICEDVTNRLVEMLKTADANGWEKPWTFGGKGFDGLPTNAKTGKRYRGMNSWWLMGCGRESKYWATFKQWLELGYVVDGGQHGEACVFWARVQKRTGKVKPNGEEITEAGMVPRPFTVFSWEQVKPLDGFEGKRWEHPAPRTVEEVAGIVHHDATVVGFFKRCGASVIHGDSRAFYSTLGDFIGMPASADFHSTEGYYSTLAHEHGHWTGHKTRLDRDLTGRFGSAAYAMEELVAELTAAFTMQHLGLAAMPRKDHADYLANWLEVLGSDPKAVYAAMKHASAAFEHLAELAEGAEVDVETEEAVPA